MKVFVNNLEVAVYEKPLAYFAIASGTKGENAAKVTIVTDEEWKNVTVRPLSANISPKAGTKISFEAKLPCKLSVEPEGEERLKPIFLFLYEYKEPHIPEDGEIYFPRGEHFPKYIELGSNQTLYIDEGATVHAKIHSECAENIKIIGRGILDAENVEYEGLSVFEGIPHRPNRFIRCKNIQIEDVTTVGSEGLWNIVLLNCKNVLISGVNAMSWRMCGDGIDICGCEDVEVEGCFMHTNDDCVAIKAVELDGRAEGCADVRNVYVHNCVMWKQKCGNAIEIGFETRCEEITNVRFEDITVIHAEYEGFQSGGVITIHNGDRAHIHNILYNNITVEDANEKLLDIKIVCSKYSKDTVRGSIDNIKIKNINIVDGAFPPSVIRGYWEGPKIVNNIEIENVNYKGVRATNQMELHLVAEMSRDITIH